MSLAPCMWSICGAGLRARSKVLQLPSTFANVWHSLDPESLSGIFFKQVATDAESRLRELDQRDAQVARAAIKILQKP